MIPFHKAYLKIFHSLNFSAEQELLEELQQEWIKNFLIIKRSWIYGLKLFGLILIATILLFIQGFIFIEYFNSFFTNIILSGSLLIIWLLLLYDSIWYLWSYKNNHSEAYIEENISFLIKKNNKVNRKFIRFFNISVFTSFLLILVLLEILIFSTIFYTWEQIALVFLEVFLILFTYFLVSTHRKLIMNLELDFSLVVPGSFYVVNQKWVLSWRQCIIPQNIKTVEGKYSSTMWSILWYGDIKIFLEWNIPQAQWLIKLDHIQYPEKVVNFVNKVL
jgi:lipopolysaccharide/colanic/teichoic acid biosynthesis glycosyltransferase